MSRYAEGTSVPVAKSRMEIEVMLQRHGADRIIVAQDVGRGLAVVTFVLEGRLIRFRMTLPKKDAFRRRLLRGIFVDASADWTERGWEQGCREKWRALLLALKAKFTSVEAGIETSEEAFLAHVVDPGSRQTVYELMAVRLADGYRNGVPALPSGEVAP